jgi:hypothetical protein
MPRISYFPVDRVADDDIRGYLEHARRHGTPRPESQAIRAHVPAVIRSFSRNWQDAFRTGVVASTSSRSCAGSTSRRPSTATTEARSGLSRAESRASPRSTTRTS